MSNQLLWKWLIVSSAITAVIIASCGIANTDLSGNSTQTGNGRTAAVKGIIYKPDGITPAPGTNVTIVERNVEGMLLGDSITRIDDNKIITDESGMFQFSSICDYKRYMIEAQQGDTLFAMIEWVYFDKDDSLVHLKDTLQPPGCIKVFVYYPDSMKNYGSLTLNGKSCYTVDPEELGWDFPPDSYWLYSIDSSGWYTIPNLPEGMYDLKIEGQRLPVYAGIKRMGIRVVSGEVTIPDTIRLPDKPIPLVVSFSVNYDTSSRVATLSWEHPDSSLVAGVNVYGYDSIVPGATLRKLNNTVITDTFFIDSGFTLGQRVPLIMMDEDSLIIGIRTNYSFSSVTKSGIETPPAIPPIPVYFSHLSVPEE